MATLNGTEAPVTSNHVNFLQPRHDLVPSRDRLGVWATNYHPLSRVSWVSGVRASCLTVPPHKTSVEIEQATSSYSFRFSELSQPI
jgi:hypothetical protein